MLWIRISFSGSDKPATSFVSNCAAQLSIFVDRSSVRLLEELQRSEGASWQSNNWQSNHGDRCSESMLRLHYEGAGKLFAFTASIWSRCCAWLLRVDFCVFIAGAARSMYSLGCVFWVTFLLVSTEATEIIFEFEEYNNRMLDLSEGNIKSYF